MYFTMPCGHKPHELARRFSNLVLDYPQDLAFIKVLQWVCNGRGVANTMVSSASLLPPWDKSPWPGLISMTWGILDFAQNLAFIMVFQWVRRRNHDGVKCISTSSPRWISMAWINLHDLRHTGFPPEPCFYKGISIDLQWAWSHNHDVLKGICTSPLR